MDQDYDFLAYKIGVALSHFLVLSGIQIYCDAGSGHDIQRHLKEWITSCGRESVEPPDKDDLIASAEWLDGYLDELLTRAFGDQKSLAGKARRHDKT